MRSGSNDFRPREDRMWEIVAALYRDEAQGKVAELTDIYAFRLTATRRPKKLPCIHMKFQLSTKKTF